MNDLTEKKSQAENFIRQASGIEATKISSSIFIEQAIEHKDQAKHWLIASGTIILSLIIIIFALFYGWWPFNKFDIKELLDNKFLLVHAIAFKLIILSAGYFILHQSVKNYKIHRHLYVINKHRHNALLIYPNISIAGEDQETRNIIVSQAAKSIFEQMPSGYLDYDDDPRPINPTAIINKIIDKKT